MLKYLPNALTTLRLLLALPICLLILAEEYVAVLWLAGVAGFSDAVDGWMARKLGAQSRYGALVDPVADKAVLVGSFVTLAAVGAIPVLLAGIVLLRDLIILAGAGAFHWVHGRYEMRPSFWGKLSTLVQVAFVLMVITQQVLPLFSPGFLHLGALLVIGLAFISGGNYVVVWGRKALQAREP